MTEDRFWEIIQRSVDASDGEQELQAKALAEELGMLEPAEIESFAGLFEELERKAFSWELWGAAYIINGGCSDDGFWYFLTWLISRGREWYERALRDPDSLAAYPEPLVEGAAEFEEFAYVAGKVYESKAGPLPRRTLPPLGQPQGEEWCEDDARAFEERWPKLFEKYWPI